MSFLSQSFSHVSPLLFLPIYPASVCEEGSRQNHSIRKEAHRTLLGLTDIPSDTLKFLEISSLEDTATDSLKMETIENGLSSI